MTELTLRLLGKKPKRKSKGGESAQLIIKSHEKTVRRSFTRVIKPQSESLKEKGISQRELAEKSGISNTEIYRL